MEEFLSKADPSILHFLIASGARRRPCLRGPVPPTGPLATLLPCPHPRSAPALRLIGLCSRPPRPRSPAGDDITSKQLRDDMMTLLIAGHETTAAVLTWTFHCITDRPDVVARLREEVRAAPCSCHAG